MSKKVDNNLEKQTDNDPKMEILNSLPKEIDHDWFEEMDGKDIVSGVGIKQEPTPEAGIGSKTHDLEEKNTPKISETNGKKGEISETNDAVNGKKDTISETSDEVNEKNDTFSELKRKTRKRKLQAGNVF